MLISSALDYWKQAANTRFSVLDTFFASAGPGRSDTDFLKIADEEISALLMVLASSRMRRNRLPLVSRLPPELLACIFSFLVAMDTPSSRALGWIRVTHVCSHWRQVTLDHSALWANVSFNIGSQWSHEMVQRANLAPLIIGSNGMLTQTASEIAVHILHSQLSCTANLRLVGRKEYLVPIMETLTSSTLSLEEVEIRSIGGYVQLPVDLFGHHAPRLRSACFRGCIIPLSSPGLRNLSHLDITLQPSLDFYVTPYLPSHEGFFDLLANMCRLESLSIDEYFPQYLPGSTAASHMRHSVIKLPHLSNLKLTGQWLKFAPFLELIEVPATSSIILDCHAFHSDHFNSALLSIFERHSGKTGDALPIRTLLIGADDDSDDTSLDIWGWTTSDAGDFTGPWRNDEEVADIGLSFHICLYYSTMDASLYPLRGRETLKAILQALHIQELSKLCVESRTRLAEDHRTLTELVESAQRLEHIACEDDACSILSSMLTHPSVSESGPVNAHDQAFSRLRFVELWIDSLGDGTVLGHNGPAAGRPVVSVDMLVEFLERREALGVPLERLAIHMGSHTDSKYLDQLRAAAQNTVIEVLD